MKNVIPLKKHRDENAQIEKEAAQWLTKFDQHKPKRAEFVAFMTWYRANPRHQEVYDAMAETWDMATVATAPLIEKPKVAQRYSAITAVAASLLLVLATTLVMTNTPVLEQRAFATAQTERSTSTLSDGSVVNLDSGSKLSTDFSINERDLMLHQGQAFFDVSHDKSRPFIVSTRYGSVRAVGTAFSVDIHDGILKVLVTEGRVEIDGAGSQQAKVMVDAGHAAALRDNQTVVTAVSTADQNAQLAWREGRLEYTGEPLSAVMQDIARYHDITVVFAAPELQDVTIGGAFSATNMEGLMASLHHGFNIAHHYDEQGHLILSKAD